MKLFPLACLFILICIPAQAQDLILSGIVKAEATAQPLAYVNIGIRKKNIGTASDAQGEFRLRLSDAQLQDSITFSAIGYQEQTIAVRTLSGQRPLQITLTEKATNLQEVVVKSKKMKLRKIGVIGRFPGVWGVPDKKENDRDVYEFANFIALNDRPAEILSAHFYLSSSSLDSALFRINFYENNNGMPGSRLVEKQIVQKLSTKQGWVQMDLSQHEVYLQEDFFMGIEYLPTDGANRLAISLGGKLMGTVYSKKSSMAEWSTINGVSLSGYVTARQ